MSVTFTPTDFGESEPLNPDDLLAKGWHYRDVPSRVSADMWAHFLSIIGDGEYRLLTEATYRDGSRRGQLLISPTGMENMKRHVSEADARTDPTDNTAERK